VIGIGVTGINVLMLPAIPFIGGHYLVDMFAGAAVAGVAIVSVRYWLRSQTLPDDGSAEIVMSLARPQLRRITAERRLPSE
jgi:membrane-associated phospholipid phosphatase